MWKNNNPTMYGFTEIGPAVPAFLVKIWKLVDDPATDEIISWNQLGTSFIIYNQTLFARELLPQYYKHNNMASFIRQLNMYGFHKVVSVDSGGLKSEKEEMEFAHPYFLKDNPSLIANIRRKLSNSKSTTILTSNEEVQSSPKNGTEPEILTKVLSDVNYLKSKQESWDARLAAMKRENEALWRELAVFRQKHLKQEQIINKLIHFIVTMVQPSSRNVPLRRRYPLMINDTQPVKKITKLSTSEVNHVNLGSPSGPTIHEIDSGDVLTNPEDMTETSNEMGEEYITSDLCDVPGSSMEVLITSPESVPALSSAATGSGEASFNEEGADENPCEWLEIDLTDNDIITHPLTPIDPAKVNPVVAASSLREMDSTNNIPLTITIPTMQKSENANQIIYVNKSLKRKPESELKGNFNQNKRRPRKSSVPKLILTSNRQKEENSDLLKTPEELLLDLVKDVPIQDSNKNLNTSQENIFSPDENILITSNKGKGRRKSNPRPIRDDPYEKEYYKVGKVITTGKNIARKSIDSNQGDNGQTEITSDIKANEMKGMNGAVKDPTLSSMAIVRQQSTADDITRELGDHVESVQSELEILKDLVKGESYSIDANTLLGVCSSNSDSSISDVPSFNLGLDLDVLLRKLFNDDPLSYGLPLADSDSEKSKENTGNELMTYTTPNLLDLVEMFNTPAPSTNNDWNNDRSPLPSPVSDDLATPQLTPLPPDYLTPNKRRKK